jgi:hypothetical protein
MHGASQLGHTLADLTTNLANHHVNDDYDAEDYSMLGSTINASKRSESKMMISCLVPSTMTIMTQ